MGQRAASQHSAEWAQVHAQAAVAAYRLELTRQVRERMAELALADLRVRQTQANLTDLETLEADVKRRVRAGDMAETDALLVRQDVLGAQTEAQQAQLDQMEAAHAFHVLVGEARPPVNVWKPCCRPSATPTCLCHWKPCANDWISTRPSLAAQAAAEQQTRRREALASATRSPWELGLQHRRDQEADVNRTTSSWGVSLTIPWPRILIGAKPQWQLKPPRTWPKAEVRRLRDQLETEWLEAQQGVRRQQAMLANTQAVADAAQVRANWIRKTYALGEMSLTERLRGSGATIGLDAGDATTCVVGQGQGRLSYAQGAQP